METASGRTGTHPARRVRPGRGKATVNGAAFVFIASTRGQETEMRAIQETLSIMKLRL